MLYYKKLSDQTGLIECESLPDACHAYLKWKDFDGKQGNYNSYEEYTTTVCAINAMHAGDKDKFQSLMDKLGKHAEDTVMVTYQCTPRNPYSQLQSKDGVLDKTFLEIAKALKQTEIEKLLKERYSNSVQTENKTIP